MADRGQAYLVGGPFDCTKVPLDWDGASPARPELEVSNRHSKRNLTVARYALAYARAHGAAGAFAVYEFAGLK